MIGLIKNIWLHHKYSRIIKQALREDNVIGGFNKLFETEFRTDWIGRYYAVINPNIREGQFNPDAAVGALGADGNEEFVNHWISDRLMAAKQFIRATNLFDLITYKLERLDEYDNFLFVFQPITLEDVGRAWRRARWEILAVLLLGISALAKFS